MLIHPPTIYTSFKKIFSVSQRKRRLKKGNYKRGGLFYHKKKQTKKNKQKEDTISAPKALLDFEFSILISIPRLFLCSKLHFLIGQRHKYAFFVSVFFFRPLLFFRVCNSVKVFSPTTLLCASILFFFVLVHPPHEIRAVIHYR